MMKTINKLTHEKHFRLVDLIRTDVEWFKTHRPTWKQAAKYLSDKLGFPISISSLPEAAALAGVTWENRWPGPAIAREPWLGSARLRI